MRIDLIGADFEENLALGILAEVASRAGHEARILPFNFAGELPGLVARVLEARPALVGLSIQFQHRVGDFLGLAERLRAAGYRGHITCGGQFPSLADRELMRGGHGVDSVVLHDGEETFAELLGALAAGRPLESVAGLCLRDAGGTPRRTAARRLIDDLDSIPFARRYRQHTRHMHVPFIPIMGSRGCWGRCNYCSIVAFYNDARDSAGGGKLLRMRSADNIASEVAELCDRAGEPAIVCFHDDNFVLPRPDATLERVRAIRAGLDARGVGRVAFVGKARPDTITPELCRELAQLGVIRLYVGVENGSEAGGQHLRRGTQQRAVREALVSCRNAGIFVCYNLLMFEPDARLSDVRENIRFIVDHADHPVNFCRAEPYFGTPLHRDLAAVQELGGNYTGYNYRIADDRTELLFRICSAAFYERNFDPQGVANRYLGLGYSANIVAHFCRERPGALGYRERARRLTRDISLDTAGWLERAYEFASTVELGERARIEDFTVELGMGIAQIDNRFHRDLDALYDEMKAFVAGRSPVAPRSLRLSSGLTQGMALGVSLALSAGCNAFDDKSDGDPFAVDPVPPPFTTDPVPPPFTVDPVPPPVMPIDAGSRDAGSKDAGVEDGPDAGQDAGMDDEDAGELGLLEPGSGPGKPRRLKLIDQWADSSPRRAARTLDLPLHRVPQVRLAAQRDGAAYELTLEGLSERSEVYWAGDGELRVEGRCARWTPASPHDHVRVAVRSGSGVAILSRRASPHRG